MINYFDLGANEGKTIELMLRIFKDLNIKEYHIWAFEPMGKLYDILQDKFMQDERIHVFKFAISETGGMTKLYHCHNNVGHSIFATKNNIDINDYEMVLALTFPNFLFTFIPSFKEDANILKVNIEGAEWYLFHDLVKYDLLRYFPMICGHCNAKKHPVDIEKIGIFQNNLTYWNQFMDENGIIVRRFTDHNIEKNIDMKTFILEEFLGKNPCLV